MNEWIKTTGHNWLLSYWVTDRLTNKQPELLKWLFTTENMETSVKWLILIQLDIIMKFQYFVSLVHPNVFFHLPECLLTIVVNALYKHWDYFLRSGLSKCGHLLASTTTTPITPKTTRSSLCGHFLMTEDSKWDIFS